MICTILFVLVSTAWYKTVINGHYFGVALHAVGEMNNESYSYWSSDESEPEVSEDSSIGLVGCIQDRELRSYYPAVFNKTFDE